jgi:hypothetical protein
VILSAGGRVREHSRVSTEQTPPVSQVIMRAARPEELALLIQIERAAGASFRSLGMDAVADDDPPSIGQFALYAERSGLSSRLTLRIVLSGISCSTSAMGPRISSR